MSGFFESFLRGTAEDCITAINGMGRPYSWLPADLRETNFKHGAAIFSRRQNNRVAWVAASPEDLVRRLGMTVSDPDATLMWEAFAETSANPNADVVIDMLKKFGARNPWNRIVAESGLARPRIEIELTGFLLVRNQAAHSGHSAVIPSTNVIRGYCEVLQKISRGFYEVLRSRFGAAPFNLPLAPAPLIPAVSTAVMPILGLPAAVVVPAAPAAPPAPALVPTPTLTQPGTTSSAVISPGQEKSTLKRFLRRLWQGDA